MCSRVIKVYRRNLIISTGLNYRQQHSMKSAESARWRRVTITWSKPQGQSNGQGAAYLNGEEIRRCQTSLTGIPMSVHAT